MNRRVLALAFASATACTPELEPIRWEPIDIEALRDAIANPTALVDEASADEVAGMIIRRQAPYERVSSYLHDVFAGAELGDAAPAWLVASAEPPGPGAERPRAATGTSVYLLVACPGQIGGGEPFEHGSVRVDSQTLDATILSTSELQGQLLVRFTACEIGPFVFDGTMAVYRTIEPDEFGFTPQLEVSHIDEVRPPLQLRAPVLWAAKGRVSRLIELDSGETLVLERTAGQIELRLRGRNGELVCAISRLRLECVPP